MGVSRSVKRKIMKRKYNKRVAILAFLVVATILISIVTIPKFTSKAGESSSATNERILKVLEIEPSENENLFRLSSGTYEFMKVEVTRMDMSRFISMVDEIDGKYDIVYIGDNCEGLSDHWTMSSRYRKYCNKNNLQWGDLWDRFNFINSDEVAYSQILWYGDGGFVPTKSNDWDTIKKFNSALLPDHEHLSASADGVNFKEFVEYYSENDITNKRAKEIEKLLDANQLVYVDFSIIDGYEGTKLRAFCDANSGRINFVSGSSGILSDMVSDYNDRDDSVKSPIVNITKRPDANSSTLNFKFYFKGAADAKYKAKLYIDTDGDGLFTGKPAYLKWNPKNDDINSISYSLGSRYVGYYQWKLEIYDTIKEDIKSYNTGYVVINGNEKKDINVLQVMPNDSKECTFNMQTNELFNRLLNDVNNYNVTVTSETINKFNADIDKGETYSNFSMIVIGFGDNYGHGTQFSDNAINFLLQWNSEKKSLMLTHDTIGLGLLKSSKKTLNGSDQWNIEAGNYCAYKLGRAFKDIAGQCRFSEDPYKNYAGVTYDDSYYESFADESNKIDTSKYATLGITAYANLKLYGKTQTEKAKLVNENQISNYPFKLSDKDELDIAQTHCQWYQLNLEEDDIVPSYNLVDKDGQKFIDSGDSRNFCYTYSKGNITFTGSGHKEITKESEMKLFINTMIKAFIAGNQKPEISNYKPDGTLIGNEDTITLDLSNVSPTDGFKFYSVVVDDSSENAPINVSIREGVKDSFNSTCNDLYNKICGYNGSTEGLKIDNLSVSYDYLKKNIGKTIKVISKASDDEGASADDAVFYIKVNNSKINIVSGINKDEEKTMADNSELYSEYQQEWYSENIKENGAIRGDTCPAEMPNIAISGTRGYQYIVPFISNIDTNVSSNFDITLKLDSNFSQNPDNKYGEAYVDENLNSVCKNPSVYINYKGQTFKIKELQKNNVSGEYKASVSLNELQSAYSKAGVNVSLGDDCSLVLKYYGKTYNHNSNGENNNIMKYTNIVEVSNGVKNPVSMVDVYVGYKQLHGNLF